MADGKSTHAAPGSVSHLSLVLPRSQTPFGNEPCATVKAMAGFWHNRRVFVTGCTGLVGAWTVRLLLEQQAHVVGLVRDCVPGSELCRSGLLESIDTVRGSLEDLPLLERAFNEYEIQTVFHLAAQTIVCTANRNPVSTFESNIRGTWCVLEAARRSGLNPQVVVASSDKAYGDQDQLPYTEEAPLRASHPYDVSKACADLIALSYARTYEMPVCVTRCGNFFGGGDLNWNRIVPGAIRSFHDGEPPILRSDGASLRDYFYVKDGAAAYVHLAECMARMPQVHGQAFNFSNETQLSVLELVDHIRRLMGSSVQPVIRADARHEIRHQYLSAEKARAVLGWRPAYPLEPALRETIDWYREFFHQQDGQLLRKTA